MRYEVILPRLNNEPVSAILQKWLVHDNELVLNDQSICILTINKSSVEFVADKAGIISLVAKEGIELKDGDLIAVLDIELAKKRKRIIHQEPLEEKEKNVENTYRLAKVASEFNVAMSHIVDLLTARGFSVDPKPTTKLTEEMYAVLIREFGKDRDLKGKADFLSIGIGRKLEKELTTLNSLAIEENGVSDQHTNVVDVKSENKNEEPLKPPGIDALNQKTEPTSINDVIMPIKEQLKELKVVGKIDLEKKKANRNEELGSKNNESQKDKSLISEDNVSHQSQERKAINIVEHTAIQIDQTQTVNESDRFNLSNEIKINLTTTNSYIDLILENKQVIFQGSPGSGKSYLTERLSKCLVNDQTDNIEIIQFHPSYGYEDFVEGYKFTSSGKFELKDGVFKAFVLKAMRKPYERFVLIIDEINRGNTANIFGELLYLLEYRNKYIKLKYSHDQLFHVPDNIYILGTMNTADRSLSLVDYALRRRFSFITLSVDYEQLNAILLEKSCKLDVQVFIENIKIINNKIFKTPTLGAGFEIGISYFVSKNELNLLKLSQIWAFNLKPLMEEYYFDNNSEVEVIKSMLFNNLNE